ncbi:Hsp20/alpha crystallin family protein [Pelotomaculum isophthalicicum JI]|uniref:Hsp20/alpha crystallin family protein n=1 Tax=Pelotomaculum isophthalicicum JI TaxID=947010 RepID=A0A9X4JVB2_9FIRM|nr:Hsp20/alpha crystallin family protein [Pelotomaculum isophthalicicum]MDF9407991.1 Hsp20/alpha crystallin family protein [Pelotomaculum isophthalicicum JI]
MLNLVETINEIIISVDLPGLQKASDAKVAIKGNTLKIEGVVGYEPHLSEQGSIVHIQERRTGKFCRTVTLPTAVSSNSAQANYRSGILEIKFAKPQDSQAEILNIEFGF